ncbi:MAG: acyltransferase family protein [Eubacteriales bacterium]|nr:acyltransferase family protein [Eubacteriales bacterium]
MVSIDNQKHFRKAAIFKILLTLDMIWSHAENLAVYTLDRSQGFAAALIIFLDKVQLTSVGLINAGFFFISGFSFFSGFTMDKLPRKWKNRFHTLLIPWLIWNTVMWLSFILMGKIPAIASRMNMATVYAPTFRSWFVDGLLHSANGPMWFMLNLLIAVALAPVIYCFIKNRIMGLIYIACLIIARYFIQYDFNSAFASVIYFSEAGYIALHMRSFWLRSFTKREKYIAGAVALAFYIVFYGIPCTAGTIIHVLVLSVVIPALWVLVPDRELLPLEKSFDTYRFWIYASHYLLLEAIEKLWLIFAGDTPVAALIDYLFAPVITMAILIAGGYVVRKYLPRIWGVLNGIIPN